MERLQKIKNAIGSFLGYSTCPVTGKTYWNEETTSVRYSPNRGIVISTEALRSVSKEKIAKIVLEEGEISANFSKNAHFSTDERLYNLDEIMKQIPDRDSLQL